MNWNHAVDPIWLAARKNYLTASDIIKLLPTTPTGRPRPNLDEVRLRVWAEKQCALSEEDITSSGAMGRGHLLEPYAIREYNKAKPLHRLHHWDDMLIHNGSGVACSPDALSAPMPTLLGPVLNGMTATTVGEVKCYNSAAHYLAGIATLPGNLDERWQIATAMYVMPKIEVGFLIFFNPSARHRLFIHPYERTDLAPELALIEEVQKDYYLAAPGFETMAKGLCEAAGDCVCEADIIADLLAEPGSPLNP